MQSISHKGATNLSVCTVDEAIVTIKTGDAEKWLIILKIP